MRPLACPCCGTMSPLCRKCARCSFVPPAHGRHHLLQEILILFRLGWRAAKSSVESATLPLLWQRQPQHHCCTQWRQVFRRWHRRQAFLSASGPGALGAKNESLTVDDWEWVHRRFKNDFFFGSTRGRSVLRGGCVTRLASNVQAQSDAPAQ